MNNNNTDNSIELSAILIDSTMMRAHSCAAGAPQKKEDKTHKHSDEPGGGFTTKLNLSLSDKWIPLRFTLTARQCNDITQASELIKGYSYQYVIGDKTYDSDAFIAEIVSKDAIAVIPPRKSHIQTRTYDKKLYKHRNIIKHFFHRLKQFRRVATRYNKLAVRYFGLYISHQYS